MKKSFLILCMFATITLFAQSNQTPLHEVIIKLNWRYLDLEAIDDPSIIRGDIYTFLNAKGQDYLKQNTHNFDNLTFVKVFPFLKTTDTISISRLGNKVRIPSFWSVFKVRLANDIDVFQYSKSLNKLSPFVLYSHPNYRGELLDVPNDPLFQTNQYNFNNALGLDYINIDSAWNIETGRQHIKIGVFDTGIDTTHPDLQILTGKGYCLPYDNIIAPWGVDYGGHGTRVAGIIGAKRNNGIGIAGIAGGNGHDTTGVSLLDINILDQESGEVYIEAVAAAIVDGSRSVGGYYDWTDNAGFNNYPLDHKYNQGFGLNIANHSYTMVVADPAKDDTTIIEQPPVYETRKCNLCLEAYLFSYENNVINITARGNVSTSNPNYYGSPNDWPQGMQDEMIISVGANATNGNIMTLTNNSNTDGGGSKFGREMDIIAPGSDSIVYTTNSSQHFTSVGDYGKFNGTSAASPHVAGAVGLLLSYYNKPCYSNFNLAHEDVEYLLQISATKLYSQIYNDSVGWGRLNARALLDSVKKGDYQIIHPQENYTSYSIVLEDTIQVYGKSLTDYGPYGSNGMSNFNEGESAIGGAGGFTYLTERYKITATYDFANFLNEPTTELIGLWKRQNTSTFSVYMEDSIIVGNPPVTNTIKKFKLEREFQIENTTDSTVTFSGYLYHFIEEIETASNLNVWYPSDTSNFHFDYSIYLKDTVRNLDFDFPCDSSNYLVDTTAKIQENNYNELNIFPNPINNNTTISSSQPFNNIIITDLTGKVIFKEKYVNPVKEDVLNFNNLSKGIYFITVTRVDNKQITKKIIKS